MQIRSMRAVALAFVTVVVAGCMSDNPVSPASTATPTPAASSSLLGGLLGGGSATQTANPLLRNTPLASNLSQSATIGILGGTIALPGAGFTIVVPPLAVTHNTTITVTALAGDKLAYEFAPHGLHFTVPLVMTQDLHNTHGGSLLSLYLGYFPDSANPTSVTETLGLGVNLGTLLSVGTIWHFSGYIIATGDEGSSQF